MKPKTPPACPDCDQRRITMLRVFSRVYAQWRCDSCGSEWSADAASGRLISRNNNAVKHIEGGPTA